VHHKILKDIKMDIKRCLWVLLFGSMAHAIGGGGGNHSANSTKRAVDTAWKQNPLNYCSRGMIDFEIDYPIRQTNPITRGESGFIRTVDKVEVKESEIATHYLSGALTRKESLGGRGGQRTINEQGQLSKVSMNELMEMVLRCRSNNPEESRLEKEAKQSLYSLESGYRVDQRWVVGADYIWAQRIVLDRMGMLAGDKNLAAALISQMKLHREAMKTGKAEEISELLKTAVLDLRKKFEKQEAFSPSEKSFLESLTQSKLGKPNELQTLIGAKALYFAYLYTNGEQAGGDRVEAKVDLPFNALTQQPEFQRLNEKAKQLLGGPAAPLESPIVSRSLEAELSNSSPEQRALMNQGWLDEQSDGLTAALKATPTSDHDRITRLLSAQHLLQKARALNEHVQVRKAAERGYNGAQLVGLNNWMDSVPKAITDAFNNERNSLANMNPRQVRQADALIARASSRLGTDLPAEVRQSVREMTPMQREVFGRYLDQMNFKSVEQALDAAKDEKEAAEILAKLPKDAQELEASRLLLRQALYGGGKSGDLIILARKNSQLAKSMATEIHDSVKEAVGTAGFEGVLSSHLNPQLVRALLDRKTADVEKLLSGQDASAMRDEAAAEILRLDDIAYGTALSPEDAAKNMKAREGLIHLMVLLDDHGQTEEVSNRAHASVQQVAGPDGNVFDAIVVGDRFNADYQLKALRAEQAAKAEFEAGKVAGHGTQWSIDKARHPYTDKDGKAADIGLTSVSRAKLYKSMNSPIHRMMLESVVRTLHARGWDDAIAALLADATEEKIEAASKKWDEHANAYTVRFFQKDASEAKVVSNLTGGWVPGDAEPALRRLAILEHRKANGLPIDHYLSDAEIEASFKQKPDELNAKADGIKTKLVLDTAQKMLLEGERDRASSLIKEFMGEVVSAETVLAGLEKQNGTAQKMADAYFKMEPKLGIAPNSDYEDSVMARKGTAARDEVQYQQEMAQHSLVANVVQAQSWLKEKTGALAISLEALEETKKAKQGILPADYKKRVDSAENAVKLANDAVETAKGYLKDAFVAQAEGNIGVQIDFTNRRAKIAEQQQKERIAFNAEQTAKLREYATKLVSEPENGLLDPGATEEEKDAAIASAMEMLERLGGGLKRAAFAGRALARSESLNPNGEFDTQVLGQLKSRMSGPGPGIRLTPIHYAALEQKFLMAGQREVSKQDEDLKTRLSLLAKAGVQVKEGMLSYRNEIKGADGNSKIVNAKLDRESLELAFGEEYKAGEMAKLLASVGRAGLSPDARYTNPTAALRSAVMESYMATGGLHTFEYDEDSAAVIRFKKNPDGTIADFSPSFRPLKPLREGADRAVDALESAQQNVLPAALAKGSFSNAFGHMVIDSADAVGNFYGLPTYVYNPRTGEGHFNWNRRPEFRSDEDRRLVGAEKSYRERLQNLKNYGGITTKKGQAEALAQIYKYRVTPSVDATVKMGEDLYKENLAASQEIAIAVLATGATMGLGSLVSGGGALLAGGSRAVGMARYAPAILRGAAVASKVVDAKAMAVTKNFWKWAGIAGSFQGGAYGVQATAAGVDSLVHKKEDRWTPDPQAPQVFQVWQASRNSGIFGMLAPPITAGLGKLGVNPIVAQVAGGAGSEVATTSIDVARGKKTWGEAGPGMAKNIAWQLPAYIWLNTGGKRIHSAGFVPKQAASPVSALSPSVTSKSVTPAGELVGGHPSLWRNAFGVGATATVGTASGMARQLVEDPDNFSLGAHLQGIPQHLVFGTMMNKSSRLSAIGDYLRKNEMTPAQAKATFGPEGTAAYFGMLKVKDLKTEMSVTVDARNGGGGTALTVPGKDGKPVSPSSGFSVTMPESKKVMMTNIGREMGFSHGEDFALAVEMYRNPGVLNAGKTPSGFNRVVSAVVRPLTVANEPLSTAIPKIQKNYVDTLRSRFLANSPNLTDASTAPAFIGSRTEVAGGFELGQLNFNNAAHRTMVKKYAESAAPGREEGYSTYFAAVAEQLHNAGGSKAAKTSLSKTLAEFDALWQKGVRIPVSPEVAARHAESSGASAGQ
jgi:hypothetical protein